MCPPVRTRGDIHPTAIVIPAYHPGHFECVSSTRDSGYGSQNPSSPRIDDLNSFTRLSIRGDSPQQPVDLDAARTLDEIPELSQITNPGTRKQSNTETPLRPFSIATAAAPRIAVPRTPPRHEPEHSQRLSRPSTMRPAPLIGIPSVARSRQVCIYWLWKRYLFYRDCLWRGKISIYS